MPSVDQTRQNSQQHRLSNAAAAKNQRQLPSRKHCVRMLQQRTATSSHTEALQPQRDTTRHSVRGAAHCHTFRTLEVFCSLIIHGEPASRHLPEGAATGAADGSTGAAANTF